MRLPMTKRMNTAHERFIEWSICINETSSSPRLSKKGHYHLVLLTLFGLVDDLRTGSVIMYRVNAFISC